MSDLFGVPFDLPTFPNPDSFRRNVVPGMIPSPTLITENVRGSDLRHGDLVSFLGGIAVVFETVNDSRELGTAFSRFLDIPEALPMRHSADRPIDRISHITFGSLSSLIPIEWIRDDSFSSMGKFASQHDAYCYEVSMDADESCGSTSDNGEHFSIVRLASPSPYGGEFSGHDPVLHQWRGEIIFTSWVSTPNLPDGGYWSSLASDQPSAGYIVSTNDQGFVYVDHYATLADLNRAWSNIETAVSEWYAAQDDEDEDDSEGCRLHGIIDCSAPECVGSFLSEVRDAELWGGTN